MFWGSHPHVKVLNTQPRSVNGYASCLDYWRHETWSRRTTCCAIGCSNPICDCAVVNIREEGYGNKWYYVPLCAYHLRYPDEMEIDARSSLVSARNDLVSADRSAKIVKPGLQQHQHSWNQTQQQPATQQPQQPEEKNDELGCCGNLIVIAVLVIVFKLIF